MPELDPPVKLADPENQDRLKYLMDVVAKPGFAEYTPVSHVTRDGRGMADNDLGLSVY